MAAALRQLCTLCQGDFNCYCLYPEQATKPVHTGQPIMMTPQSRLQIALSKHLLFFFPLTRFPGEYANPTPRPSGEHVIVLLCPEKPRCDIWVGVGLPWLFPSTEPITNALALTIEGARDRPGWGREGQEGVESKREKKRWRWGEAEEWSGVWQYLSIYIKEIRVDKVPFYCSIILC